MTVKRLSNIKLQYDDGNGALASNYRLFFYAAGSSTKQNTYNSSTGGVANSNPIVLNALGEPAVEIWLTAGQSYKVGLAIPGSDDPPASFVWTEDNITGVNDITSSIDQWVSGPAPTFISATSFSLVGDQTTIFHVGRRIKTTNTAGTVYSTISASVFGAVTTITVVNDSGTLDSGLSAVSYGLLAATNPSTPLLTDTYPIASGSSDKTKKVRLEVDGLTTATTRVVTVPDRDLTINDLSSITNTIGADVALNNTANYFDGPTVAQGVAGTWFASGTVVVQDTAGAAAILVKLWDGTTVIASAAINVPSASVSFPVSLSGFLASPAGNIRMSARDVTSTSGAIKFNASGLSKDSTLTAIRVA